MKKKARQKQKESVTLNRAGNRLKAILAMKPVRTENQSWFMVYLDVITLLLAMFILFVRIPQQEYLVEEPRIQTEQIQETPVERPSTTLHQRLAEQLIRSLDIVEGQDIAVKVEQGRVNLQLPASILFNTGEAFLLEEADEILVNIVTVLQNNNFPISVEGHTDNVPIRSQLFPSNWELSAARASVVIRRLQQMGIPKERMKAIGYADTLPISSNDTPQGRSENRRVSLIIHAEESINP